VGSTLDLEILDLGKLKAEHGSRASFKRGEIPQSVTYFSKQLDSVTSKYMLLGFTFEEQNLFL
jgi:hypothetical protein